MREEIILFILLPLRNKYTVHVNYKFITEILQVHHSKNGNGMRNTRKGVSLVCLIKKEEEE